MIVGVLCYNKKLYFYNMAEVSSDTSNKDLRLVNLQNFCFFVLVLCYLVDYIVGAHTSLWYQCIFTSTCLGTFSIGCINIWLKISVSSLNFGKKNVIVAVLNGAIIPR